MRFAPRIDIISLLVQILSNFEKSHFLEFHLWVFSILMPVEYSTGAEMADYCPEPLQIP